MFLELLEQAIMDKVANGKKPKANIAVHLYGMPYDGRLSSTVLWEARGEIPLAYSTQDR